MDAETISRYVRLPYKPKATDHPHKAIECAAMVQGHYRSALGKVIIPSAERALDDARNVEKDENRMHYHFYADAIPHKGDVYGPEGPNGEEPVRPVGVCVSRSDHRGEVVTEQMRVLDGRDADRASLALALSMAFAYVFDIMRYPYMNGIPHRHRIRPRTADKVKVTIYTRSRAALKKFAIARRPNLNQLYEDDDTRQIITRTHFLQSLGVEVNLRWMPHPPNTNGCFVWTGRLATQMTSLQYPLPTALDPPAPVDHFGLDLLVSRTSGKVRAANILGCCRDVFYFQTPTESDALEYDFPDLLDRPILLETPANSMAWTPGLFNIEVMEEDDMGIVRTAEPAPEPDHRGENTQQPDTERVDDGEAREEATEMVDSFISFLH